jgi:hypothetical protein
LNNRRVETGAVLAAAAVFGVVAGWLLARQFDQLHRGDLFAPEPWRRRSALGWLTRERDPARLPLLRDYLAWEEVPALKARAWRLIGLLRAGAAA